MKLPTAFNGRSANGLPVVSMQNVGVKYRVPHERIVSVKEYVIRRLNGQLDYFELWALQGVYLDIRKGEVIGIVGANGSGKSTLLRVISRVLCPTEGRCSLRGRVFPLLELGAGFNYELTGSENIFLNGAILGFSKADIRLRFNRIVAFAGIRDFIHSPLRVYSRGMVARLGFSIAMDVQPEILIVDEVLAVGDIGFQEKCMERMNDYGMKGSTIILVTHQTNIIEALCGRAVWLDAGRIQKVGPVREVLPIYQSHEGVV